VFEIKKVTIISPLTSGKHSFAKKPFLLEERFQLTQHFRVRAHGMWTYEPRQGRKAATAVCSASAVVTLTFFQF